MNDGNRSLRTCPKCLQMSLDSGLCQRKKYRKPLEVYEASSKSQALQLECDDVHVLPARGLLPPPHANQAEKNEAPGKNGCLSAPGAVMRNKGSSRGAVSTTWKCAEQHRAGARQTQPEHYPCLGDLSSSFLNCL